MSYEIIKGIKIEDNKVYIKGDSNNVYPKDFKWWLCDSLTKILKEKGQQELDIEILKAFEEGNFQSSLNLKYTRALKVLYYLLKDEYALFSWRNNNFKYGSEEYKEYENRRKGEEFKALLSKALNTKIPKEKYVVYNPLNSGYVKKVTSRHIFFCSEKENAKKYDFKLQAEELLKNHKYEVEQYV